MAQTPPDTSEGIMLSRKLVILQVVTSVDPFGYYAETVQQGLDDAFHSRPPRLREDVPPSGPPANASQEPAPPVAAPVSINISLPTPASTPGTAATTRPSRPPSAEPQAPADADPSFQSAEDVARPPHASGAEHGQAIAGEAGEASQAPTTLPASRLPRTSEAASDTGGEGETGSGGASEAMTSVLAKDAFLVFRALCKLSIRTSETAAPGDLTSVRGKVPLVVSTIFTG